MTEKNLITKLQNYFQTSLRVNEGIYVCKLGHILLPSSGLFLFYLNDVLMSRNLVSKVRSVPILNN